MIGTALSTLLGAGILFAILNPMATVAAFAMLALEIARRLAVAMIGTEVVIAGAAAITNFLTAALLAAAAAGVAVTLGVAIGIFVAWVVEQIAGALGLETTPVQDAIVALFGVFTGGRIISFITDVVVPFWRSIGVSLVNGIIAGVNSAIGGLYSLVNNLVSGINGVAGSVGVNLGLRGPEFDSD